MLIVVVAFLLSRNAPIIPVITFAKKIYHHAPQYFLLIVIVYQNIMNLNAKRNDVSMYISLFYLFSFYLIYSVTKLVRC